MRKARTFLALVLLGTITTASPPNSTRAFAQSAPQPSCTGQPTAIPMQGHYTGMWHSDGDYHFAVFNTDLDLKVTLDGTLDLAVSPDGHVSGRATASVNAPITDYGRPDISGGIGTISGPVSGVFTSAGSLLVLSGATIDMHWGTFGGGHAVERMIDMPDYSFPVSSAGCVSASGSIAETNFPVQNVVADQAGQMVQVPGIGAATGTWQIQSDKAARFQDLSQQVDSFTSSAAAALSAGPTAPSAAEVDQRVIQPLRALQATIKQDPEVARCLLERLARWEGTALPALLQRAQALAAGSDVGSLRQAGDLVRAARSLDADCALGTQSASDAVAGADQGMLDRALQSRDWGLAALAARELLLLGTPGDQLRRHLGDQIHSLVAASRDARSMLMTARFAYAVGDASDARAVLHASARTASAEAVPAKAKKGKKKKHRAAPRPTATAVPRPTATSLPPTLPDALLKGAARISGSVSGGPAPRFSWSTVPGATRYVLFVTSASGVSLGWSWAGGSASTTYGDTAIDGLAGSAQDGWPSAAPLGYRWSVLALDGSGEIVGLKLPDQP